MSQNVLLAPSRLFTEIDAQPPLMRVNAANAYIGKEVDWNLFFLDGSEPVPGMASIMFNSGVSANRIILGEVSLTEHPYLRALHSGEPVRVRGKIRKIDGLCIDLDITELMLAKAVDAVH